MQKQSQHAPRSHGGARTSHIHLPMQVVLGLLFLATGSLLLLKAFNYDFMPFIPEKVFVYINALGSVIGGFYLVVSKIWRPRIYV